MDNAISVLYKFRLENGLEEPIFTIQGFPEYPPEEYEMCSDATKRQALVYIAYNYEYEGPKGPYTDFQAYEPLTDRILAWLKEWRKILDDLDAKFIMRIILNFYF